MMARGAAEDAVLVLQRGLQVMPYDAIFYRLLGKVYRSLKKNAEATQILRRGAEIFPQDPEIRELLRETEPSSATGAAPTTR
jgi:Flp pilus assembly protein TadD